MTLYVLALLREFVTDPLPQAPSRKLRVEDVMAVAGAFPIVSGART